MDFWWNIIPKEEIYKIRFPLKLWLVTNDPSMTYLRWNKDCTILIVNSTELMYMFTMGTSNIFMCKTIKNFIWLLHKNAFKRCPPEVLDESERDSIKPECMLFWHPQFYRNNNPMFDAWLTDSAIRVHEPKESKGSCTLPPRMEFIVREVNEEFTPSRMNILVKMLNLRFKASQSLREQENASFTIPAENVDYSVMDVPDYFKTKEIEGNYGPVSVSELKQCLGNLLPISDNDLATEEPDEVEEMLVLETSSIIDDSNMLQEATESNVDMQYNDVRALYESAESWTDADGYLYEEYEIGEQSAQENTTENVDGDDDGESILLLSSQNQPHENLSEYLTNSVQACLPAIDSE
uniref:HSF-type DNA-binding domain-containing protein n=1 Tax=Anopheles funestus TaxID=62324 RepID=A0A182REZ0_ANOFN